jgi:hypothetical protein
MARTFKVLDLSTAHLPEAVAATLTSDIRGYEGCIADEHGERGEYGCWVWVPDNPGDWDACKVPDELLRVLLYARGLGCEWVLFDRDAERVAELPIWEW